MNVPLTRLTLGLAISLGFCACSHARRTVYLRPGQALDMTQLDMHKQSLVMEFEAGEILPLEVVFDGELVGAPANAIIPLKIKRKCFLRIDDRGMRISENGRDFDERHRRQGSFQFGVGLTPEGKKATLRIATPVH